jgi:hypothetical protein
MARTRVKRKQKEKIDWLPIVALMGVALGFFTAYLGAETILNSHVHSLHWLVAFAGGVVGYLVGMLWYWRRGDVI